MSEELRNSCAFPETGKPCGNCTLCKLRVAERERDEARKDRDAWLKDYQERFRQFESRALAAEEVLKFQHKEWLEEAGRLIQDKEAAEAENASLRAALAAAREVNTRLDAQWADAEKRNASLLESLRAAEKDRDAARKECLETIEEEIDSTRAAAAAEQRNTALEGALREVYRRMADSSTSPAEDEAFIRAALHDEEQSTPPENKQCPKCGFMTAAPHFGSCPDPSAAQGGKK